MPHEHVPRRVLVLGASGLIGRCVTDRLRLKGFTVIAVARRFAPSFSATPFDLEMPLMALDEAALTRFLGDHDIDVVVNCVGALQDGPGTNLQAIHHDFVARLLAAIARSRRDIRLVHISIPGTRDTDRTAFSRTKRAAETLIAGSGVTYAILRPGFVIAPAAYGGSAMLRALAALPFNLPKNESAIPFQPVAIDDIAATLIWLAERSLSDPAAKNVIWDLMQLHPVSLGQVIDEFRRALGTARVPRITVPSFMLDVATALGDLSSRLGWTPPVRSNAIAELRRGVDGDPAS